MATKMNTLDYGGLSVIVGDIRISPEPGLDGISLVVAEEIDVISGVTPGTATAEKALVLDADGAIDTLLTTGSIVAGTSIVIDSEEAEDGPVTIAGEVIAAGTDAGAAGHTDGAVATHVLVIDVGGSTYYIPLCNTNTTT